MTALLTGVFLIFLVRAVRIIIMANKIENRGTEGFIYIVSEFGQLFPVVKIGRTNNLERRFATFRTATPFFNLVLLTVSVPDMVSFEKYLHQRYRWWRIRKNGEWFFLTPFMLIDIIVVRILLWLTKPMFRFMF